MAGKASCLMDSRHLGFFFLAMFLCIFEIVILLYAALTGNVMLVFLSFALLAIIAIIIIIITLWQKSERKNP